MLSYMRMDGCNLGTLYYSLPQHCFRYLEFSVYQKAAHVSSIFHWKPPTALTSLEKWLVSRVTPWDIMPNIVYVGLKPKHGEKIIDIYDDYYDFCIHEHYVKLT